MKFSLPVRIFTIIAAVIFFVFSYLQRNDVDARIYNNPSAFDAALWLLFYFLIGVLLLVALWRKVPLWLVILGTTGCLLEMITTLPGLLQNLFGEKPFEMTQAGMSAKDPRVELTREFFGALIALLAMGWIYLLHRKVKPW
jgi:Transmembrane family 220, helix